MFNTFKNNEVVAVYCRVSSDEQTEKGTIENQRIYAEKYVDLNMLNVYDYYMDDGITGTIALQKRPEGKRLLDDAKAGKFNLVLFFKLDRLGRSVRVILNAVYDLQELNVDVRSMTEAFDTSTPSGRFALTAFAGIAELERDTILTRMRQGTLRHAEMGKWLGGPVPYGYRLENGFLQIADDKLPGLPYSEAEIVQLIFHKIVNEKCSAEKVSDYLNTLGVPTKYKILNRKIVTSGYWQPSRILCIVHNTVYYGLHVFGEKSKHKNPVIIKQQNPPIIPIDLWDAAQKQLTANMICSAKNKKHNYLLSGLIKCGLCGSNYNSVSYKGRNGEKVSYYVCNDKNRYHPIKNQPTCKAQNLRCDWIDNIVWNDCLEYIQQPEKIYLQQPENNSDAVKSEIEALERSALKLDRERSSILDLYRKAVITETDLSDQLSKIAKEQEKINKTIRNKKEALSKSQKINEEMGSLVDLLKSFQQYLTDDISFEDKRKIVKTLVESIIVYTDYDNGKRDIPFVTVAINYIFKKDKSPLKQNYDLNCVNLIHGFCALMRIIFAGKDMLACTRLIVTTPSSNGWRRTSSVARENSGSSSKNSTPLCANVTSPGRGMLPPPISALADTVWCGLRNGRSSTICFLPFSKPAML